jgi:hypothetical protein
MSRIEDAFKESLVKGQPMTSMDSINMRKFKDIMNKSDNQKLTELLGGCWHEGAIAQRSNFFEQNYGQNVLYCKLCKTELESDYKNNRPTYTHADEVLIPLREKLGEEKYEQFITSLLYPKLFMTITMPVIYFTDTYILNIPALVIKAIEFLEKEKCLICPNQE